MINCQYQLVVVAHNSKRSTQETKAKESLQVQGQPELHSDFHYSVRVLKNKTKTERTLPLPTTFIVLRLQFMKAVCIRYFTTIVRVTSLLGSIKYTSTILK